MSRAALSALAVVVALHVIVMSLALRHNDLHHAAMVEKILDVALIVPPPAVPALPQPLPHAVKTIRMPTTRALAPSTPARDAAPDSTPAVQLFNADGSTQLPAEPKAAPQPFAADVTKGRELMGRGLSCEGPDALGGHDSLGDTVARKYLSWIGMYNPYKAQLRAAEAAERLARCRHWTQPPPG